MRALVVLGLLLCGVQPARAQKWFSRPDSARMVTEDVKRFLATLDLLRTARSARDSASTIFEHYYMPGTAGLREFIGIRLGSVHNIMRALRKQPRYFNHLRTSLEDLDQRLASIPAHFTRFETIYPDAIFGDTYFIVGVASTGGTISRYKNLIGAEMYGRDAAAPVDELTAWQKDVLSDISEIDVVVVHELIHVNHWAGGTGLLRQILVEGGADFLAELVTGRNLNASAHAWANPREAELWQEFQRDLKTGDMTRWLYNGGNPARGDRPADLGYWLGYRITQTFYERATDKREAIREILNFQSADDFLKKSGYGQ